MPTVVSSRPEPRTKSDDAARARAPSPLEQAIHYGSRAKLGLLLPSGNVAAEPQFNAMLPQGVSLHTSRLKLTGSSLEQLLGMVDKVEEAAALVADAEVDLLAFHCTAVSTHSEELERSIIERVSKASGRPVVATSQAIAAALAALQARKVVLVTPYLDEINQREIEFLARHGVSVLDSVGLGIFYAKDMISVTPREWIDLTRKHMHPDADAYFISCTAVRSIEAVEPLERELGRPVITSNQVMVWHSLRQLGLQDRLPGLGRLLSEH